MFKVTNGSGLPLGSAGVRGCATCCQNQPRATQRRGRVAGGEPTRTTVPQHRETAGGRHPRRWQHHGPAWRAGRCQLRMLPVQDAGRILLASPTPPARGAAR